MIAIVAMAVGLAVSLSPHSLLCTSCVLQNISFPQTAYCLSLLWAVFVIDKLISLSGPTLVFQMDGKYCSTPL